MRPKFAGRLLVPLALVTTLFTVTCLDEAGAPGALYIGRFAVAPTFVSGTAGIVQIAQVRVVLARPADQSVALDTTVTVTPGAVEVDLSLTVPVFSSSEVFIMTVEFITPDGVVAFEGGPVEVTTTVDPDTPPVPVELATRYVGPGFDAQSVQILTTGATVRFGETVTLTAEALDASAQPIAGTPIGWSSLNPTIGSVLDPAVASVLGESAGIAQIVAELLTGPADTTTVTVVDLAVGEQVSWTNAAGGNWSDGGNWSRGVPPGANDTAVIDLDGAYTVNLDVPASVAGLNLGGATGIQTLAVLASPITFSAGTVGANGVVNINNAGSVSFTAAFDNAGTVNVQTGALTLTGGGNHSGSFTVAPTATLDFGGGVHTVSQTGTVSVTGSLTVSGGSLDLGLNGAVVVGGDFSTTVGGVLKMDNTASLIVGGNASFGGGSTVGTLPGGVITVSGNFSQSGDPASFAASGTQAVFFAGTAAQTISFGNPGATASRFQELVINNLVSAVSFSTNAQVNGNLTVTASILTGVGTLTVAGDVTVASTLSMTGLAVGGVLSVTGTYSVTNTTFTGGSMAAPQTIPSLSYTNVDVTGIAAFPLSSIQSISGDLVVSGTGSLDLNGSVSVTVSGNFRTQDTGTLTMLNSSDQLDVTLDIVFGGGNTATLLEAGLILARANFTQSGDPESFHAGGTHTVDFLGTAAQTVTFTNPGIGEGVLLSHFAVVGFNNTGAGISLASNVFAHSELVSFASATPTTVLGNGNTLAVGGLQVTDLVLNHVLFEYHGDVAFPSFGSFIAFDNVLFTNYAPTETQFTIIHPGDVSPFTFNSITFNNTPTTGGYYMSVTDSAADANTLTIVMFSPLPATPGAFVLTGGGAIVSW